MPLRKRRADAPARKEEPSLEALNHSGSQGGGLSGILQGCCEVRFVWLLSEGPATVGRNSEFDSKSMAPFQGCPGLLAPASKRSQALDSSWSVLARRKSLALAMHLEGGNSVHLAAVHGHWKVIEAVSADQICKLVHAPVVGIFPTEDLRDWVYRSIFLSDQMEVQCLKPSGRTVSFHFASAHRGFVNSLASWHLWPPMPTLL